MEMRKLLIADAGEEFRLALARILRGNYMVRICQDGYQTLEVMKSMKPDVLVLDLLLPGLDGISLLQKAAEAGLQPVVLATTAFSNDYVVESLARLGVGYVMMKPCDLYAVTARISDLHQHLKPPVVTRPEPRTMVSNMLLSLGVPTKLKGYACLREAVLELARDPAQQVTKELYPKVAKIYGGNGPQAERLIRTAIDAAWKRRDERVWRLYFQPGPDGCLERPTNFAFLSALAERLTIDSREMPDMDNLL